jgi:hypothetical protein
MRLPGCLPGAQERSDLQGRLSPGGPIVHELVVTWVLSMPELPVPSVPTTWITVRNTRIATSTKKSRLETSRLTRPLKGLVAAFGCRGRPPRPSAQARPRPRTRACAIAGETRSRSFGVRSVLRSALREQCPFGTGGACRIRHRPCVSGRVRRYRPSWSVSLTTLTATSPQRVGSRPPCRTAVHGAEPQGIAQDAETRARLTRRPWSFIHTGQCVPPRTHVPPWG